MPTVTRPLPYIHLQRDGAGRIVEILHRREGDAMPDEGESDMGLFALPSASFTDLLPRYARRGRAGDDDRRAQFPAVRLVGERRTRGRDVSLASTRWRRWASIRREELQAVEAYLAARESASS